FERCNRVFQLGQLARSMAHSNVLQMYHCRQVRRVKPHERGPVEIYRPVVSRVGDSGQHGRTLKLTRHG
ncbi:hypothetical protein LSAT2_026990, partial [Lamellibrachia satsuma]